MCHKLIGCITNFNLTFILISLMTLDGRFGREEKQLKLKQNPK